MMPWDWIGIVTIRSEIRCSTSTNGMMNRKPGVRSPITRPNRNSTPFSYCLTMRTDIAAPNNTTMMTATNTTISAFIVGHLMGRRASRDEMGR